MFMLSVPFSFVSDIGAMSILSLASRDYRIFTFPLIPFTLIAAMFRVLFCLILFLLALLRGLTGLFSGFIIFISGFRLGFLFVLPLCSLQFQLGFYFLCHFFCCHPYQVESISIASLSPSIACVWTRSASVIITSSIPFSFVVPLSLL